MVELADQLYELVAPAGFEQLPVERRAQGVGQLDCGGPGRVVEQQLPPGEVLHRLLDVADGEDFAGAGFQAAKAEQAMDFGWRAIGP